MALTKEQLLSEIEDVLRNAPPEDDFIPHKARITAWVGRFAAVIRAWDSRRATEVLVYQKELDSVYTVSVGYRHVTALLHEASYALRMETGHFLSAAIPQGQVFDYFDEVRRVIEAAKQDLFFVDPYLDAEFVSRYLSHVTQGVTIRLLAGKKLAKLLPAVDLFATQYQRRIEVRSSQQLHDRHVFVDRALCYQSGASFKDAAKSAGTTLTQIVDAFAAVLQTYEDIWNEAKIER